MAEKFLTECIKYRPKAGNNLIRAAEDIDLYLDGISTKDADAMLASLAGTGASVEADRAAFVAAVLEPIMQVVPYMTLYDRFFMDVTLTDKDDPSLPVEDHLVSVSYASHPQTGVFFVRPGYLWYRPTFSFFTTGFEIPWNLMSKAGWNVLERQMKYAIWDLAKKQDAVAKAVVDAIVPTSHKSSVTGGMTRGAVNQVIRASNQIGFPVKNALINPGRLMEMQDWTWGGTGFFISPAKSDELLDNLFISTYGNLKWFADPYVPANTIYLSGDPNQFGWHETRGTPRNDTAIDIKRGVDEYTLRSAEHSYYAQSGLATWTITII